MMQTTLLYREPAPLCQPHWHGSFEDSSPLSSFESANLPWARREPRWKARVDQRLAELSKLRRGWDGYGADPISSTALNFAGAVLESVMTAYSPAPSIVPTHGGGLQLEWHIGGIDVELMIYRPFEAELNVSFSDGRAPIEDRPLSTDFSDLSTALREIA
jgi:hypothetical protein